MNDLKEIKQTVVSYGLHSAFDMEIVKTWASSNKEFLEIMSPLEMAKIKVINLLDQVEGVTNTDIGPMNADQQKTDKGA